LPKPGLEPGLEVKSFKKHIMPLNMENLATLNKARAIILPEEIINIIPSNKRTNLIR
jgi:hypothetical protein